jgi:hypothetical protein
VLIDLDRVDERRRRVGVGNARGPRRFAFNAAALIKERLILAAFSHRLLAARLDKFR